MMYKNNNINNNINSNNIINSDDKENLIYCQECDTYDDLTENIILKSDPNEKKPRKKCPHGKRKDMCVECGGSGICIHKKPKSRCIDCGGSSFCIHKKYKASCIECNGSSFCIHKKQKSRCIDCDGSSICIHKKRKEQCIECNGSSVCIHKKQKSRCIDCGGSSICEHKKRKMDCVECDGSQMCIHKKHKSACVECKGSQICIHNKHKQYCKPCGGSALCKLELCITRGIKKYEGYCAYCYVNLFPDKIISRNYKNKERNVVDSVKKCYPDFTWVCDRKICDGCSKRRPDMLVDLGTHIIIIEVDENAHTDYACSCEHKRLMELSEDVGGRPIVFIRFNPDQYIDSTGKMIKSCWKINGKSGILQIDINKKDEWKERINALNEEIQYWIDNPSDKTVEIVELFY